VPGFVSSRDRYRQDALISPKLNKNPVFVTTDFALKNKDIPLDVSKKFESVFLKLGEKNDQDKIIKTLIRLGYRPSDTVIDPGTFRNKGDIVDVFPPYFVFPLRCSFNFNTVDRLSYFDPSTQLSTKNINQSTIKGLVSEPQITININLTKHVDGGVLFRSKKNNSFSFYQKRRCRKTINTKTLGVSILKSTKTERLMELKNHLQKKSDFRVFIAGKKDSVALVKKSLDLTCAVLNATINKGFYSICHGFFVISANDLLMEKKYIKKWNPAPEKNIKSLTLQSLTGLEDGDYLVHKRFGVGVYRGMVTQKQPMGSRDVIKIEYKDNASVFVSIENMGFLHRHLGTAAKPVISSLSSKRWELELRKTRQAVRAVAKELLDAYKKKQKPRPFSYCEDSELERALASSFSFTETPDQKEAINVVLSDMLKPKPVDRLICGDVGFGKTEVALRAIMRAVISKKSCMLLCPTTILADQHYITCKERLEPLGVRVALLSRFKTKKEQSNILEKCASGRVDLLIGTHRLLSSDVIIPTLSLLVVDEEHRFGVRHKEKIRGLKAQLDVITLSATPIPRTLQQSTAGLRNITKIQTPPVSRKPINTDVCFFDWGLINKYIERELMCGGQVYFVSNNINTLPFITDTVSKTFPKFVSSYIHGQMPSGDLEERVLSFFEGGIDVLVCTSIIESGLDVTNSNCIIVNDAQNFGLSQLYQMRGRVGRGERQAHCLLLVPKKQLDRRAFRRLKTIEQYTSLGSGYDISMKDLEIRGAGNLFGYKQSGHIGAVGFEMYCSLLKDEIDIALNNKEPERLPDVVLNVDALIPDHYIKNPSQRLGFYDRLSRGLDIENLERVRVELFDRFGHPPKETENLINLARIRILFKNTSINRIEAGHDVAIFELDDIKPFKSVETLIFQVSDWASANKLQFSFGKTTVQNLLFTLHYKSFKSGVSAVCSFAKLF